MTSVNPSYLAVLTTSLIVMPPVSDAHPPPPSPTLDNLKEVYRIDRTMLQQVVLRLKTQAPRPFRARRLICLMTIALLFTAIAALYFTYFHHGSTTDILAANGQISIDDKTSKDDYEYFEMSDNSEPKTVEQSIRYWKQFLRQGKYVDIGSVWTSCKPDASRLMIGKSVLTAAPSGGLQVETHVHLHFKKAVTDGLFYVGVTYNGKDLYSNKWPLCTVDKDAKHPVVNCPFKAGHHKLVKINEVSSYIPKGTYMIKICVTDQDDREIVYSWTQLKI